MDAKAIYQDHLDRVSRAVWDGDVDAAAAAMHYPQEMRTLDDLRIVTGPEQLKSAARAFRAMMDGHGATAYHRLADTAAFVGEGERRIEGTHHVFLLKGGTYVIPPYPSTMTLVRKGDLWLGAGISVAIRNTVVNMLATGPAKPADTKRTG